MAFHLCTADRSTLDLDKIIASLGEQLAARVVGGASTTARSPQEVLGLARNVIARTGGKVVLVVDGIDEACAGRPAAERTTILDSLVFRGQHLPTGVFVLLAGRKGTVPPIPHTDVRIFRRDLAGLAHDDLREMLVSVVSRYELQERHIRAVEQVSSGNPLYVRMLAEDLTQGKLRLDEIDRLPEGVEGYFENFIGRFASADCWPTLRDCLLLLAVSREYLPAAQVAAITGLPLAGVQQALEEDLQPLLIENLVSGRAPEYQLFHQKFREFVLALYSGVLTAPASRLNRPAMTAMGDPADPVVDPAHLARARSRILEYCRQWERLDDEYPLRNFSAHLFEQHADDELEVLLRKSQFLEQKVKRLGDPFLAAEDVRYLGRTWLAAGRTRDLEELAVTEVAYQRDGIASALRVADPEELPEARKIIRGLLERTGSDRSSWRAWPRRLLDRVWGCATSAAE